MDAATSRTQLRYSPGSPVDLSTFLALGSLENIGATVLNGEPEGWVRYDFAGGDLNAGLFASSAGTVRYTFPSTEHATVLEGLATFTDEEGVSQTYGPGDSYFIAQGQVMTCSTDGRFVKSFFNARQPSEAG